jgi:hypothetical protein
MQAGKTTQYHPVPTLYATLCFSSLLPARKERTPLSAFLLSIPSVLLLSNLFHSRYIEYIPLQNSFATSLKTRYATAAG